MSIYLGMLISIRETHTLLNYIIIDACEWIITVLLYTHTISLRGHLCIYIYIYIYAVGICLPLPSNQSFNRLIPGYEMGVVDCEAGQLEKDGHWQQIGHAHQGHVTTYILGTLLLEEMHVSHHYLYRL